MSSGGQTARWAVYQDMSDEKPNTGEQLTTPTPPEARGPMEGGVVGGWR